MQKNFEVVSIDDLAMVCGAHYQTLVIYTVKIFSSFSLNPSCKTGNIAVEY
ncbi:MAG: hypothetical protein JNM57_10525 [Cyclobacteriaceae bacterium]|nr:hypothetical protein [Cyclobacteriaceae bacterium]